MKQKRLWVGSVLIGLIALSLFIWHHFSATPISVVTIQSKPFSQAVVAAGHVQSQTRARIGVEITGTVQARHVLEGDTVRAGDPLLSLTDTEFQSRLAEARSALDQLQQNRYPQAQVALTQAEIEFAQAQREADRKQRLLQSRVVSVEQSEQADQAKAAAHARLEQARLTLESLAPGGSEERTLIERVENAQAALDKTQIRAPFDGLILARHVEPGDQVQPGRTLLEMVRMDDLEILVPVDERHLSTLDVGQTAQVIADAFENDTLNAHIRFIAPMVDRQRGTVDVYLTLDETPTFLREDMTVTATITTADLETALLVPNSALKNAQGQHAQVLVLQNNLATERAVKLGRRDLMQTQILDGLAPGEAVLLNPTVRTDQRIRPVHVD